jgi:hypothetical protein
LAGTIISTKSLAIACGIGVARNYVVVEKSIKFFKYHRRYNIGWVLAMKIIIG